MTNKEYADFAAQLLSSKKATDIIVNLFTPEMRDKYNIEKIWADCPVEHIGD